jgi:hypothetical protein
MKQTLQGRWRAIERQSKLLPHDCYRRVDVGHAAQHVGDKVAIFETLRIAPIGDFVVRRPIDIVEDRTREALLRHAAEVMKIVAVAKTHDRVPLESAAIWFDRQCAASLTGEQTIY